MLKKLQQLKFIYYKQSKGTNIFHKLNYWKVEYDTLVYDMDN